MTEQTGVLVVDDSAFMRKIISQIINDAENFYVVATARDGNDALQKIQEHKAAIQIVTLDIQMPKMDGLTCLKHIMSESPKRVIMVSSLTTEGARETLTALDDGAIDFITKPGGAISIEFATVAPQLLKALENASHSALPKPGTSHAPQRALSSAPVKQPRPVPHTVKGIQKLVAIASSTGGPKALANFIPYIPGDINAALLLVQHMPPTFTNLLAERLDKASEIHVVEAKDGDHLVKGTCLVAPGGYHMEVNPDETVTLTKDPPIGGLRPCADITFRTAAPIYGSRATGVVLTGMGHDGTDGCRALKDGGSKILVESKETALIYGMPKSVVTANLHDVALPIGELADAVVKAVR